MPEYYPPVGFHFRVEFGVPGLSADGNDVRFQEVSGLSSELGIETYEEGGENRFSHRFPNRGKFSNLVLKRGMLVNSILRIWIQNAIDNFDFIPIPVTVILLDENHTPRASWVFLNAWPVKWSYSDFKAQDNSLVIETIELAYNNFTRIQ